MNNYKMGPTGKQLGMTQIFTDDGKAVHVTDVRARPCQTV